jgi:glycosyltransferase involved in cell wall biosynthesis
MVGRKNQNIFNNEKIHSINSSYKQNHKLLFYLSDYRYGGGTTFTAHLLHMLRRKHILCLTKAFEKDSGDFGYGIKYYKKSLNFLDNVKDMFIVNLYKNFYLLDKLKDKKIIIIIHSPGELCKENESYIKNWKVIVIRKAIQTFLKNNYDIKAKFLYHPFYTYKKNISTFEEDKKDSVSISRIDYYKNIDIILKANKELDNPVKIYGLKNPEYIASQLSELNFDNYYHGLFDKSFNQVSKILSKAKFMVDLSELPNDGGGTQYTFLEAIYNNSAIILNRKWIDTVNRRHSDFKEDYNCYAVSNEQELRELIKNSKHIDTTKVTENAKKLMFRHTNTINNWNTITS